MKIYWSSRSPFVRKVMIVAHELGLANELALIRTIVHPAKPNSEVMAFNPLGKIPTLVLDDGSVLYDSRVICEFLEARRGKGLLVPSEGPERWRVLTWQAQADGLMETALLWLAERAKPDGERQNDIIAGCRMKMTTTLDQFEKDTDFTAAGEPTLGHIAIASALLYLDFRFASENWNRERPQLRAWSKRFNARPSVMATAFADIY